MTAMSEHIDYKAVSKREVVSLTITGIIFLYDSPEASAQGQDCENQALNVALPEVGKGCKVAAAPLAQA